MKMVSTPFQRLGLPRLFNAKYFRFGAKGISGESIRSALLLQTLFLNAYPLIMTRKEALKYLAAGTAAGFSGIGSTEAKSQQKLATGLKGNVNHSVCRWCYNNIPLEELCDAAVDMGIKSVEIIGPNDWQVVLDRGMTCAMSNGSPLGITKGFNDPQYHEQLAKDFAEVIPQAAEKGIEQIICFSGNRGDIPDDVGLENSAKGLEPVVKMAEKYKVRIVMELLNSKVNHPDYQCDHTPWGVQLVEKVGSDAFGLLYDIYHMQIMEGDVIATIQKYHPYIMHYHTGGVPGRHEIDETQELYYPAIIKAILDTGYTGFVGQEFIPAGPDPLAALKAGVMICDV